MTNEIHVRCCIAGGGPAGMMLGYLLGRAGFRRIYLKTLDWNERARRCFVNAGFAEYGRAARGGNTFVLMECRQEWLEPDANEGQA